MIRHIVWDDSFKVDHHLIDSQHKRLFAMVDELYNFTLKTQEQQKEDIMMVLQECVKYTVFHFSAEEELMDKINYPAKTSHVKQHTEFKIRVTEAIHDYSRGNKVKIDDLYSFLTEWLVHHVTKVDKALGLYASTHNLQEEPEES